MSIYLLTLIAFALAIGSVAKSVVGIGLPLCAMPVLSLFLGVPHAAAIVVLPIAVTNAWQVWQFRSQWSSVQFLRTFLFLGVVGTVIGTYALARVPSELLSLTLGLVVVVYLAMRAARPALRLDMRFGRQIAPAVGLVAGTFHGAIGISAPIGVTYLHAMPLTRGAYLLSISLMFLLFAGVQIPAMVVNDILTWSRFLESMLALVPVAFGMVLGSVLGRYVNERMFDAAILVLLTAAAGPLLFTGIQFLLN